MKFHADQVKLSGPRVDGTYVVSLSVGEYERHKLKELLDIPPDVILEVTVEVKE